MPEEVQFDPFEKALFALLRYSLTAEAAGVTDATIADGTDIGAVILLAKQQQLLEVVIEAILRRRDDFADTAAVDAAQLFCLKRTAAYLSDQSAVVHCLNDMKNTGIPVVMLKGVGLAWCYPKPHYRLSGDTDIYVPPAYMDQALAFFRAQKFHITYEEQVHHHECRRADIGLIELHKELFGRTSVEQLFGRAVVEALLEEPFDTVELYGCQISVLGCTNNFCFIAMHAAKHFIYEALILRQLLDVVLFARANGAQIDWPLVWRRMVQMDLDEWLRCVFYIGARYFGVDLPESATAGQNSRAQGEDAQRGDRAVALLKDICQSGTLNSAVSDDYVRVMPVGGKKEKISALSKNPIAFYFGMFFAGTNTFVNSRYQYVKKYPFLLPIAWVHRLCHYLFRKGGFRGMMRIGRQSRKAFQDRTALFHKLKMLK